MNERKLIERLRASRPEPPKGFAERIDCELVRLQAGKDAKRMKHKIPMAALVAILLLILTAFGAIAATVAGNLLKEKLNAGGAGDVAEQVRDVHAEQAVEGFSFSVEQCYWEGHELCFSYKASVPEDGNTYLLGLEMPVLNGERLTGVGHYLDDDLSGYLMVLGGEHMTTVSEVLRVTAYANQTRERGNVMTLRAAIMTPNQPIPWTDADRPMPMVELEALESVQELRQKGVQRLSAKDLEDMGLVKVSKTFEIDVNVDDARYGGPVYRGVEQRELRFNGFNVSIRHFELSHLTCAMTLLVIPEEGVDLSDVPMDFALYRKNGQRMTEDEWICWAWPKDGAVSVTCFCNGILDIGGADRFLLVPMGENHAPDLGNVARITPTQEQPANSANAVWATPKGNYYHTDRYCMDMTGAEQTTVEAAEAEGKQPCPVCAG